MERAERVLGAAPELRPVLLGGLFKLAGRASWGVGDPALREAGMLEVESRAMAYDLPAIRWPKPWPGDYLTAMRVATWADADVFKTACGQGFPKPKEIFGTLSKGDAYVPPGYEKKGRMIIDLAKRKVLPPS